MGRIKDIDTHPNTNITGRNIRKLRKENHLTQEQLSAKLELMGVYVCRGSVSRIENCSRLITDIELSAIAEILQVPIERLFEPEE